MTKTDLNPEIIIAMIEVCKISKELEPYVGALFQENEYRWQHGIPKIQELYEAHQELSELISRHD